MGETNTKGRRAADRRRERMGGEDEGPREATTPGLSLPPDDESGGLPDPDVAPERAPNRRGTGVTNVTSVGVAARDLLRERPAEPTAVRALQLGPELRAGRLICLEGKDVGKSFDLVHDVMVVGRSNDAHIKLTDPAISRAHFEIRYDAGSGTFFFHPIVTDPAPLLNGEEAAGSDRELADGDVIEAGESTIRFVRLEGAEPRPREVPKPPEPEPVAAPAPPPPPPPILERTKQVFRKVADNPKLTRRSIGIAVVAGVLLVAGSIYGYRAYTVAARQATLDDPNGSYQQLLAQVPAMRQSRKWQQLQDTGTTLSTLAPERDDGAKLEREGREEATAEKNLNVARMGVAGRQFDVARGALRLIPDTSVYAADRDKLLFQVDDDGRLSGLAAIRELMEAGRFREAAERAELHLRTYPKDQEAAGMRATAVRTASAREALGSATWQATRQKAMSHLEAGDLTAALATAQDATGGSDAAQARRMAGQLEELQQKWSQGRALLKQKSAKAVGPLKDARELEEALAGGRTTPLGQDIARALADAYYLAGIEALGAGKECEARTFFERADSEKGGDAKVVDKLSRLAAKGRTLLGEAEAARARGDKAAQVRLARDAACRLPRGDEDRAKAERLAGGKG
ncbi:MAG: FHA domain-containing protein [Myxococcota bacterium]